MLFMQPVVVNDAHAQDRAVPAEVRLAEPRPARDQPTWTGWTGSTVAQAGMDSRSPFGPNAVDHNDITPPGTAPHQPTDTVAPPAAPRAANPADSSSSTRIPPAQEAPGQTDAGPPGGAAATTATPGIAPSPAAPGAASPVTTPGAGNTSGATQGTTPTPPASTTAAPSSTGATGGTLPGGSSGASNSR